MKRYVFGKSVKGATHEKNGLPLQDNCKIEEISDKITIIAVADGHGSSKCPRSDRGSLIAVNTFCTVMKNYLLNYGKGWSYESGNISEQRRRYALRTGHM